MKSSDGGQGCAQIPSHPQLPLGRSSPGQDAGCGHKPTHVRTRLWGRVMGAGWGEGEHAPPP